MNQLYNAGKWAGLALFLYTTPTLAQEVTCSGNITLTTQAEVDAFPAVHGCTEMTKTLTITGNDITNLDNLYSLTRIEQLLIKNNPGLLNLNGLSNLQSVGAGCQNCSLPGCVDCLEEGIYIQNNAVLENINGLSSLSSVKANLVINSNPKLTDLDGLSSLTSIGGMLEISNNATLTNLDALAALDTTGYHRNGSVSISIGNNPALTSIKGLRSITVLPAGLALTENASLVDLQGLESLISISGFMPPNFTFNPVTGLYITGNISLQNIDALSALSVIRATGSVSPSADLMISNNPVLQNLNGLSSLTEIGGANAGFTIDNNDLLTDIDPLLSLTKLSGFRISFSIRNNAALANVDGLSSMVINGPRLSARIENNPQLNECCGLYHMVSVFRPDATITISGNGAGCTKEDIIAGGPCEDNEPVVCNGGITLTTQAEVDAFPAQHGCTEITGMLKISGTDIINIDSLYSLIKVSELLIVENDNLTNLDGLSNLEAVTADCSSGECGGAGTDRGFTLHDNTLLSDISGLSSLTKIGPDLLISFNPELTNLQGLNNVVSIGGRLRIRDNSSLGNLDGLSSLASIERYGLEIINNPSLTSLEGLSLITSIPGSLTIINNASLPNLNGLESLTQLIGTVNATLNISNNESLTNIDALSALSSIGGSVPSAGLIVSNNPALTNLNGLQSLTEITGATFLGTLEIINNASLQEVDGLSALTTIEGFNLSVTVRDNASLANVNGLSSLRSLSSPRPTIIVSSNPALVQCCGLYQIITDANQTSDGFVDVSGNGAGCTEEEILASGPCESTPTCSGDQLPQDKYVFAENPQGPAPHSTNIIVNHYEAGIMYELRKDADSSHVAGPQPGSVGLFVQGVTETTTYHVIARNPETGCERQMSSKPVVTIISDPPGCIHPADKSLTVQDDTGYAPHSTYIYVQDFETDIVYTLRLDADNSHVDGPKPGSQGLFTGQINETTQYNVLARNPETGCELVMSTTPVVTVLPPDTTACEPQPLDKNIFAESDSGSSGMATNIIVINGEDGVEYLLRRDADDSHVSGPYPSSVGLYTGPLYETTTFNVLAINQQTQCSRELTQKVTIRILNIIILAGEQWTDVMIRKSLRSGEESFASTNYNTYPRNSAIAWTSSGPSFYYRSLLRFDLNAIQPGTLIEKAELQLFSDPTMTDPSLANGNSQLSGSNACLLQMVTQDWNDESVTWNTQPSTTTTGQVLIPSSVSTTENIKVDITNYVQQWVNDPASNFGMLMQLENEAYYRSRNYGSEDHPNTSIHPKLEIILNSETESGQAAKLASDKQIIQPVEVESRISLYPNPSNGEFDVVIEEDYSGLYLLKIHDFTGRALKEQALMKEGKVVRAKFDLNLAPEGMYVLSVYRNGMRTSRKIVITE